MKIIESKTHYRIPLGLCFPPVLKCKAGVDVSKSDEHTSAGLF